MHKLINDLKTAASAAFQSEDYQTRPSVIDEAFQKKQFDAFTALREKAAKKAIILLRTPVGFAMAPSENGEVVPPDQFNAWTEEKRREVQADISKLEKELEHIVLQMPLWDQQRRDEIRELNRETAKYAIDHLIEQVRGAFTDMPHVVRSLGRTVLFDGENAARLQHREKGAQTDMGRVPLARPVVEGPRHQNEVDRFGRNGVRMLWAEVIRFDLAEDGLVRDALPKGGVRGIGTVRCGAGLGAIRQGRNVCAPCYAGVGRENLGPPSPDARIDFNNRHTGLQAPQRQRFVGMAIRRHERDSEAHARHRRPDIGAESAESADSARS